MRTDGVFVYSGREEYPLPDGTLPAGFEVPLPPGWSMAHLDGLMPERNAVSHVITYRRAKVAPAVVVATQPPS